MNEEIRLTVSIYFEITNSEMYGGQGSEGYMAASFDGMNIDDINMDFVNKQIEIASSMMHVSKEDIKIITKTEYETNTEDVDEDEGQDNEMITY